VAKAALSNYEIGNGWQKTTGMPKIFMGQQHEKWVGGVLVPRNE
jgi:hypothetical protein